MSRSNVTVASITGGACRELGTGVTATTFGAVRREGEPVDARRRERRERPGHRVEARHARARRDVERATVGRGGETEIHALAESLEDLARRRVEQHERTAARRRPELAIRVE